MRRILPLSGSPMWVQEFSYSDPTHYVLGYAIQRIGILCPNCQRYIYLPNGSNCSRECGAAFQDGTFCEGVVP